MTYALRARIECKRFPAVGGAPPKHVVQNVTLDVPENGFVALFGPSGCGKTTILNLLAGVDQDFEGQIDRVSEDRSRLRFPGAASAALAYRRRQSESWC